MAVVFTNNASSLLSVGITAASTSIQVADSSGFPFPTGGDVCYVTLEDDTGDIEIVRISANDGAGTLTVDTGGRGIDGTTAQAFDANVTRVEVRLVKSVVDNWLQLSGGALTGNLDLNGNNLVDAKLTGASTQVLAGEIVAVPLRGLAGASGNEIAVPTNGTSRATAGGADILVDGDDLIPYLDTAGVINFSSATVGVRVPGTAYLRVEGTASTDYFEVTHDDVDVNFTVANATDLNITGLSGDVLFGSGIDLDLAQNQLVRAELLNYRLTTQSVSASTTTNIDYSLGHYVDLGMDQSITTMNITNVPTGVMAVVRIKVVQDATGSRTVTNWPGTTKWREGTAPTLSTAANSIDFVDLWTDDGGTTWYGDYALAWS